MRNSRHSNLSHPYTIVRGFGLLVQGKTKPKTITKKATDEIKRELKKHEKNFSKKVWSNIINSLDNLNDEDFANVDLNQLVSDLIITYSERTDLNGKKNG